MTILAGNKGAKTPMAKQELSIIIPVFNGQDYIGRCLDSVLNQSGAQKHEIIVVNDGSTDNTGKIVSKIAKNNKNIKLINQKNMGVSAARNNGMRHSYGKYVTFIDADDIVGVKARAFEPAFYEEYLNGNLLIGNGYHYAKTILPDWLTTNYFDNLLYATRYTNADVIFGGKVTVNFGNNHVMEHIYQNDYIYTSDPDEKTIILNHADIRESANFAIYNKNMLRKHKLNFIQNMQLDEDMLFCMLAVLYSDQVATVKDATYLYNRHENTLSNITDTTDKTKKFALATIQRYSVLLNELKNKPKHAQMFNCWMKKFSRQGVKYANLYPQEFAPHKCAFECSKSVCGNCAVARNMRMQICENITNHIPR